MVGLLLVTHGELADALVSSSKLIMGECENLDSLGLYHGDSTDELLEKITERIIDLNSKTSEGGVLVLADLFGGSPSNAVASAIYQLRDEVEVECITGVNLPVLLEVASQKDYNDLQSLKEIGLAAGGQSIVSLKEKIGI